MSRFTKRINFNSILLLCLGLAPAASFNQCFAQDLPRYYEHITKNTALVLVDVQPTFISGALPVANGVEVVDPLMKYAEDVAKAGGVIVTTQDWHPKDHCSFVTEKEKKEAGKPFQACRKLNGTPAPEDFGLWPPHGISGTPDAEVHSKLADKIRELKKNYPKLRVIEVKKGMDPNIEAYSGFLGKVTGYDPSLKKLLASSDGSLQDAMKRLNIDQVLTGGLATNFCVKSTAIHAKEFLPKGTKVVMLNDASRGVEIPAINLHIASAIEEMFHSDVKIYDPAGEYKLLLEKLAAQKAKQISASAANPDLVIEAPSISTEGWAY